MNRGCKYKKGDILRGLRIISDPYKVDGDRNYRAIVKCIFCDSSPYEVIISEVKRHVFDGCGCKKDRSNSINWKSFEDWCKENKQEHLLEAWDYDLNNKTPDKVSSCTSDYYYFKCPKNKHESSQWKILSLTRYGKVKTVCKKCNSFAQYAIDKFGNDVLYKYWDYKKNTINPFDIQHSSKKTIWIKCINSKEHESYPTLPYLFLKGVGCPKCANEQQNSKLQDKVNCYLGNYLNFNVKHERDCSLIATNPKNGYALPYDNEITVGKFYLIIEVHGVQHYDVKNGWNCRAAKKKGVSPKQVLEDMQWRDEYKKQYAISQGYYYLVIPYWAEYDESYKTLIDNKIQEILSTTQN